MTEFLFFSTPIASIDISEKKNLDLFHTFSIQLSTVLLLFNGCEKLNYGN